MGQDLFGNTELFMLHFIGYFFLVSNYYHTFISHKAYASNSRYYSLIMFFIKRTTHWNQFFKLPPVSLVAIGRIRSWFLLVRSCLIISF